MLDVILCTYNSEDTIKDCVDSILGQTFSDFNLYVFDDNSKDGTVELLREFNDDRITLISSEDNVGTYAAKNFVFKNFCKSQYIALHDADDTSEKDRFESQINFMRSWGIQCLGTCVTEFWENGSVPHTTSLVAELGLEENERKNIYPNMITKESLGELKEALSPSGTYENYVNFKFCMNGSVMFNRFLLEDLGGWDGHARVGGDTDIFIRSLAIANVYNLQQFLYNRRFHKGSLTASKDWGIGSKRRRKYNLNRAEVIESVLEGKTVVRDFYYPEFKHKVIKCVD